MIGATTSPCQAPSAARYAAPRCSRIAARVDRFLPERSKALALKRRRAVPHFGPGEERLQPGVDGAGQDHAAQHLEPLVVGQAGGDRLAAEESVAGVDHRFGPLREPCADADAGRRLRSSASAGHFTPARNAFANATRKRFDVGRRRERALASAIERGHGRERSQTGTARRRRRRSDRATTVDAIWRGLSRTPPVSPGRIGRVRGSRPRRARLPTQARMPQKTASLTTSAAARLRQRLPEKPQHRLRDAHRPDRAVEVPPLVALALCRPPHARQQPDARRAPTS